MSALESTPAEERRGIVHAAAAYSIWGVMPLYWNLLDAVSPLELAMHRVLWCALAVALMTALRGRWTGLLSVFRTRQLILALAMSSVLISINWGVFLYAIQAHRLIEASFGYFVTPLFSMAIGILLLGERVSSLRLAAMVLAGAAMALQATRLGHFPWIALVLATSFALYGYIRKMTPVDPLDGLTVETVLLAPLTLLFIASFAIDGSGAFVADGWGISLLLIAGGPLTALPLALFASGARRVRMTTLGFLQYIAPSIMLVTAVAGLGETFGGLDAITFGCTWTALLLVALEKPLSQLRLRRVSEL